MLCAALCCYHVVLGCATLHYIFAVSYIFVLYCIVLHMILYCSISFYCVVLLSCTLAELLCAAVPYQLIPHIITVRTLSRGAPHRPFLHDCNIPLNCDDLKSTQLCSAVSAKTLLQINT
jgi:hypothetical protein